MGLFRRREETPDDPQNWNRLVHEAGFHTGSESNKKIPDEKQDEKHQEWIEKRPEKRAALSSVRDHLYHLIDAPHRDHEKQALFGTAKAFPETTREGYRSYLKEKLQEKVDEGEDPKKIEEEATNENKDHLFDREDYSLIYRIRSRYHAEFAEFLGTFVVLAIGQGASVQAAVGGTTKATYTTVVLSWGIAVMLGIYVAGGYSGAHLNPVVTLTLWFYRGFPVRRMLSFWLAQLLGALAANAWVFILYYPALKLLNPDGWSYELGTVFYVMPHPQMPIATAWFNEVTCAGIMHIVIFAVGDSHNVAPARGMNALVLGLTVTAVGSSFGYLSAFGMNPVRDLAPRFFLSMVGFPKEMWTRERWFWLVGEIMGPVVGGIIGAGAYDLFIFDGPESPINFPMSVAKRSLSNWFHKVTHPFSYHKYKVTIDPELGHDFRKGGSDEDGKVQTEGQPAQ